VKLEPDAALSADIKMELRLVSAHHFCVSGALSTNLFFSLVVFKRLRRATKRFTRSNRVSHPVLQTDWGGLPNTCTRSESLPRFAFQITHSPLLVGSASSHPMPLLPIYPSLASHSYPPAASVSSLGTSVHLKSAVQSSLATFFDARKG